MTTILVVDDDREMGRLMRTLFELEGYEVSVTRHYHEILPTLRQIKPDIMLLDLRIQNRETIPLVQRIRQEEGLSHIPVVMTSGMDRRRQCLEAGADVFVLKPFLPDELVQMVVDLLEK